ncbi:lipoprotein NlpD [Crenobacter luteus]|uniref:peptidoglycan DD-metalloendopeptidase family protein n=1 Tax=Crenobacter luteus TaxID=1452487 RepID=UPI0010448812|nr:peptidoglycan DD-metalloendopeptidase family protein [Crenobacter luteus]TCP14874.1 lipoprotein NlpD [Crenobacter luteus]
MSKKQLARYRTFACVGLIAGLSACTTLTQSGAPIEAGTASRPAASVRPSSMTGGGAPDGGATSVPLSRPTAIRPDGARATTHVVAPGETLYRIAVNNGLKYQDLAAWNQLPEDFGIKAGQTLRLTPPEAGGTASLPARTPAPAATKPATAQAAAAPVGAAPALKPYPKALKQPYSEAAARALPAQSEGPTAKPAADASPPPPATAKAEPVVRPETVAKPAETATQPPTPPLAAGGNGWIWPTQGKLLRGFTESSKGIDIGGKAGQPILAVGDGKVVYSGTGLRGYGKLIILKHDKTYLTAYAHNSQLLVREGQDVKKGQKIAEMGNSDADQVKLHFEVRRFGKPVDPAQYLDKQS